jgi:hypothetical protein
MYGESVSRAMRSSGWDGVLGEGDGDVETILRITCAVLRLEENVATPVILCHQLEKEKEVHYLTSYSNEQIREVI